MRSIVFLFASALLLLIAASGCGSHSHPGYLDDGASVATRFVGPDAVLPSGLVVATPSDGFVPLALGDRWGYHYRFSGTLVSDGSPLYDESGDFTDDIACEQDVAGLHYFVSRRLYNGDTSTPGWTRYRQDRSGLYIRDLEDHEPPPCGGGPTPRPQMASTPAGRLPALERFAARLPGGAARAAAWRRAYATLEQRHARMLDLARGLAGQSVAPGEIQQLAYPLVPGRSWVIRDDPHYEARVDGSTSVRVGRVPLHGWSIRIRSEFFGPNDVIHFFWGRAGFLGIEAVFFAEATDDAGNVLGLMRTHETQSLTELQVASSDPRVAALFPRVPAGLGD